MAPTKVTVFSLPGCPHCKKAKKLLTDKGVDYTDIDVAAAPNRRDLMIQITGKRTVPQIFLGDKHVGGNDVLQKLETDGELDAMLKEALDGPPPTNPALQPLSESEVAPARPYEVPTEARAFNINGIKYPYDKIIEMLRSPAGGLSIDNRKYHLQSYAKCFVGSDFVDWAMKQLNVQTRDDAVQLGTKLMEGRMFHHVCRSEPFRDGHFFYRLQEDETSNALNMKKIFTGEVRPANKVAAELRRMLTGLYDRFLDDEGVDYEGMAKAKEFKDFQAATSELQRIDLASMNREEMLAFGINIYNMLVIHAFCTVGPPNGMWGRLQFFSKIAYNLGGHTYVLSEIENGLLRGNKVPPGAFKRPFGDKDPRRQFVIQRPDARIHFALNCGAKSCPPIKIMTPDGLDAQLKLSTEAYLEATEIKDGEIAVSKLFKWYSEDFGANHMEKLMFIEAHLPPEKKAVIAAMSSTPTIQYLPYDWTVNAKKK